MQPLSSAETYKIVLVLLFELYMSPAQWLTQDVCTGDCDSMEDLEVAFLFSNILFWPKKTANKTIPVILLYI